VDKLKYIGICKKTLLNRKRKEMKKEEEKQMFELKTQENEVQGIYLHTNLKFFYLNKVHLILFYFTPK